MLIIQKQEPGSILQAGAPTLSCSLSQFICCLEAYKGKKKKRGEKNQQVLYQNNMKENGKLLLITRFKGDPGLINYVFNFFSLGLNSLSFTWIFNRVIQKYS